MSTLLRDLLHPSCIELDLKGKKKPELLSELVDVLLRDGKCCDRNALITQLLEREKLSSTGIGSGIAIPHCMTSCVSDTFIAFGRKIPGIRFDAVDNQPVSLFFLIVGPKGNPGHHLMILSKIARYLHDQEFCNNLRGAESPDAVREAFLGKETV